MRFTALLCLIGLLGTSFAQGEPVLAQSAPLLYTVRTGSETVDSWSAGIVAGLIGEAYRKSHEKFLAALRSSTGDGSKQKNLLSPFACLKLDSSAEECRRMLEEKDGISDQKLIALLGNEPTRSARVVELGIIFDGRFFQVPTRLYDVRLTDQGGLLRDHELVATYITTYSRKLHQEDIATGRNDTPFEGKIGSREAQAHFWHGGSSPRLVSELDKAVQLLADLWAATLSPVAAGVFAGDHSDRTSLPQVRDVVARNSQPCKTLHGNFLVAKDLGDYLWLTFPGKQKNLLNNFFVEPRCGFDY
ncbi:MAG: hypothetical protein QM808_15300 [Steroidobacteraceae bacterium]